MCGRIHERLKTEKDTREVLLVDRQSYESNGGLKQLEAQYRSKTASGQMSQTSRGETREIRLDYRAIHHVQIRVSDDAA